MIMSNIAIPCSTTMRIDFEIKGLLVIGFIHGKDPEDYEEDKFLGMKFPQCIL